MSLTFSLSIYTPTQKPDKHKVTTVSPTTAVSLLLFMLIALLAVALGSATMQIEESSSATTTIDDQYEMVEYLNTQTVLTDTLRQYIEALQNKVDVIKRWVKKRGHLIRWKFQKLLRI